MMAETLTLDFDRETLMPIIEDFWRAWFIGASNPGEGRELGTPSRMYTADPSQLSTWIALNEAERLPSYMSIAIYSERDSPSAIDRLFYDFDSKDLEAAWREAMEFSRALERRYGCRPLITFSGRKGFHVHIFLEKPYRGSRLREVYAELQAMTLRGLELRTLDRAVIGDVKRLSRIPYTVHEESGAPCIPVDHRGRPVLIDASSLCALRHRGIPWGVVEIALSHVEERAEAERVRRIRSCGFKSRRMRAIGIRPCLQRILEEEPEPDHLIRVALVAELHAEGYGPEGIAQLFHRFRDYDPRETKYQVGHIIRGRYHPFKCSTLQTLGICLGAECPLYRRRWRWVRSPQG